MSKILVALHRAAPDIVHEGRRIRRILEEITPDIARDQARYGFAWRGHHLQGTLNLPEAALRAGMSLVQGKIYGSAAGWAEPGAPFPDGSYALIRADGRFLEAVSDPAGSRSLWYYFDEARFVVSNSQRAITLYTGRFDLEPQVVPWLLATGALGLGMSYNRHLRALPPASSVCVDAARWTLRRTEGAIDFAEASGSPAEAKAAMREAIEATLASFGPEEAPRMGLALSGGADSRAIAAALQRAAPPGLRWQSFTGGPAEGQRMPETDVFIAAQVAAALGTRHRFIATHRSTEPVETVIDRFILASEGRVDHLGGYLDGLVQFPALAAQGIEVIIRGDTCFGGPPWRPAESELAMRQTIGLLRCHEIATLAPLLDRFGLPDLDLPAILARRPAESLLVWRDRLYLRYRATSVLSALTETKTAFTEVVNPFLSRRALAVACALPDPARLDKALFRDVIRDFVPDLPYAQHHGGLSAVEVLRRPGARRLLGASLASGTARTAFGDGLLDWLQGEIALVHLVRAKAARTVARLAGRPVEAGPMLHPLLLAFRVHMARVMIDRLQADAALLTAPDAPQRRSA